MKTTVITATLIVLFLGVSLTPGCRALGAAGNPEGAWQPDHYGWRIEITGDRMLVLWRNRPVLETTFTAARDGEKCVLRLAKTGLRYRDRSEDFATITECYVLGGKMVLRQRYSLGGEEEEEIFSPTRESRYGDVTVETEKWLPALAGRWRSADGYELEISADGSLRSRYGGKAWYDAQPIAVVRDNDDFDVIRIVHQDPAEENLPPFWPFVYRDGKLVSRVIVTDMDPPETIFEKVE